MAWTNPATVAPYDTLSAAFWNEQVRSNTQYLKDEADAVGMVLILTQTFTGSSSIQINNCFSSAYDNYFITHNMTTASGIQAVSWRFSAGGTPNQTIDSYVTSRIDVTTTVGGGRGTGTSGQLGRSSSSLQTFGFAYVGRPFANVATTWLSSVIGGDNAGQSNYGTHNQAVSYDGINVFPGGSTITGTLRIYGLRS